MSILATDDLQGRHPVERFPVFGNLPGELPWVSAVREARGQVQIAGVHIDELRHPFACRPRSSDPGTNTDELYRESEKGDMAPVLHSRLLRERVPAGAHHRAWPFERGEEADAFDAQTSQNSRLECRANRLFLFRMPIQVLTPRDNAASIKKCSDDSKQKRRLISVPARRGRLPVGRAQPADFFNCGPLAARAHR